jgi:hypothetical protein
VGSAFLGDVDRRFFDKNLSGKTMPGIASRKLVKEKTGAAGKRSMYGKAFV